MPEYSRWLSDDAREEVACLLPSTGCRATHTKPGTALPREADDSPLTTPRFVTMHQVWPATADGGGGFGFAMVVMLIPKSMEWDALCCYFQYLIIYTTSFILHLVTKPYTHARAIYTATHKAFFSSFFVLNIFLYER